MSGSRDAKVGLSIILAAILFVAAAIWLGNVGVGGQRTTATARFRTLGGVGVGDPVTLRGVKVGRVDAIRLTADDWVEADLRIDRDAVVPAEPVAIAASATLFGDWQIAVMGAGQAPNDPEVRRQLLEAGTARPHWPGATLPDIGQLTAQASRIAGDVASVTARIEGLVDTATIGDLRASVNDLRQMADRLVRFTDQQTGSLERIVGNAATSSDEIVRATSHLEATLSRIDSSTAGGEVGAMVRDARDAAASARGAGADLKELTGTALEQRERVVGLVVKMDEILSRLSEGEGTLGMLSRDSTLYREATLTVVQLRSLLGDIQANPRRYFRFSVF